MGSQPQVAEPVTDQKTRLAPRFQVIIHNDDVTPADFVVHVLVGTFHKEVACAYEIMLEAHTTGAALVTVLALEEAEFRVEQATSLARTQKYPLTFSIEPE
ncbi:MAG TPA: ATP-dependent Clp protease adaptor ClpS [Planctomycetota bacterium]|jgi:ATP-dependent Clp protease adaptor protein ClpS